MKLKGKRIFFFQVYEMQWCNSFDLHKLRISAQAFDHFQTNLRQLTMKNSFGEGWKLLRKGTLSQHALVSTFFLPRHGKSSHNKAVNHLQMRRAYKRRRESFEVKLCVNLSLPWGLKLSIKYALRYFWSKWISNFWRGVSYRGTLSRQRSLL